MPPASCVNLLATGGVSGGDRWIGLPWWSVRALYQGQATITRADGSCIDADVTIWLDDTGSTPEWGGRTVVTCPGTLSNKLGNRCVIRWSAPDGVMVGEFILGGGQITETTETYRMLGCGELTTISADG
jgi:hypothetical protein